MRHCPFKRDLPLWMLTVCAALWSGPGPLYGAAFNPPERILARRPAFEGQTQRALRYRPEGTDFVIENGTEFFNRPLYGGNTAFRADAGDKPELSFYLPGQAGNLRLGVRTQQGVKWLHETGRRVSRYRPGSMVYEIGDEILGDGKLHVSVLALYEAEGVILRAQSEGPDDAELIMAYGGAGGKKGKRGGDIGCESEPVGKFFQLRPEHCKGNTFTIQGNTFILHSKIAEMAGFLPEGSTLAEADANRWHSIEALTACAGEPTELPVVVGTMKLSSDRPVYIAVKRVREGESPLRYSQLEALFEQTRRRREAIAGRVTVETPDAYINAAAAALNVAADAIWDEPQGSVMHGAVAWRSRYTGWRGPYANDALGWHDRAKRHFTYWAKQQNTKEVSDDAMGPDPASNLARSHPAKQSSGDIGGKHYDMNLVYIDALFRHALWTGDLELIDELWPVIERHFAWERRLFRREFGAERLPLYEAYAAIWASDDLQYSGGGVTHASAYNYYHNKLAARFAALLGRDPSAYEREAGLILRGMREHLWLRDGWYGEWKDLLGRGAVHPSAALWTFYHTLDSEAADPMEAWQMSRFVDTQIAHIPVHGGDIGEGRCFTLPTTSWMPYTWSTNNVVMAEAAHTALAFWQAQRPDQAFALFKGCLLDSMYMGLCPGNTGMTTYFDTARGEAQRDFGDAVGTCARALVEGLFGIRPDVPAGRLTVRPSLPEEWEYARLKHPDVTFDYRRSGRQDVYSIRPMFSRPPAVSLVVPARYTEVAEVTINGKSAEWRIAEDAVGGPHIEIRTEPSAQIDVVIRWKGKEPSSVSIPAVVAQQTPVRASFGKAGLIGVEDPQGALADVRLKGRSFEAKAAGTLGHRTVFAKLRQGQMTWLESMTFEIRRPYEILASEPQSPDSIQFQIRNNTSKNISTRASIYAGRHSTKADLRIPAYGLSEVFVLPAREFSLLPGSNRVCVEMGRGQAVEGIVTNWKIVAEETPRWAPLDLRTAYNDTVTRIFRNEYLSPRSPYCSLSIPKQGIGSWCDFARRFEVDDAGLRQAAQRNADTFLLPQGIPFHTPGEADAKNILFTSQWDNYPVRAAIDLSGRARHLYLLMAGSTHSMQSRFDNGEVIVTYADGAVERLALHNPTTWWPIDQDYYIDDYGFRRPEPIPPRVDLKTGKVRVADLSEYKGRGGIVPGGAATVLNMPLRPEKELKSLEIRALANEVVIGLMSATLVR